MVRFVSIAALCSTLAGMSRAAGAGTAQEYADGTVHARIMGIKMVCSWYPIFDELPLIDFAGTMGGRACCWPDGQRSVP